jgi:hypothetical protein
VRRAFRQWVLAGILALTPLPWVHAQSQPAIAQSPATADKTQAPARTTARTSRPVALDACAAMPQFARQLRFIGGLYLSTNLKNRDGLFLMGRLPNGQMASWRHPSWAETGPVSAYARDKRGNIYLAATPFVQAASDAAWRYRTVWKIDSATGVLKPWLTLPVAAKPHAGNPYGILGMAYDCTTDSLYVTSVMGSDYEHKKGIVYRIDVGTGTVEKLITGLDAMGVLAMASPKTGKQLLLGSARSSAVLAVPLDRHGKTAGKPRLLFRLQQAAGGRDDRARRLQLNRAGELTIKAMDFDFTLRSASDAEERWYRYQLDPATGQWKFKNVKMVRDRLRAAGLSARPAD